MRQIKYVSALFFLLLFLSSKVAGLHLLTHHSEENDVQHCELCEITSAISFTPVLVAKNGQKVISHYVLIGHKKAFQSPEIVFLSKYTDNYRFTRPPPYLA